MALHNRRSRPGRSRSQSRCRRYFWTLSRRGQHRLSELFRFSSRFQRRLQPGGELGSEVGGISLQRYERLFLQASTQRYQNFESTTPGDVITILHAPSLDASSVEHAIGQSPFYWSYDASAEDCPAASLRFEPRTWSGVSICARPFLPPASAWLVGEAGIIVARYFYTQQLVPSSGGVGGAESDLINRKAVEGSVEIRPPAVDRVYGREFWDGSGSTSSSRAPFIATSPGWTISRRFCVLTSATF